MKTKQQRRQYMLKKISLLSEEDKHTQANVVCSEVIHMLERMEYASIVLYSALPDELHIDVLIEYCLQKGKGVSLPRVINKEQMQLYTIRSLDELGPGAFGILEPGNASVLPSSVDVIVVPGRVFDVHGRRIGRGNGYYDRLLVKYPTALKIGVCFDVQLVDTIVYNNRDVPMDKVISGMRGF